MSPPLPAVLAFSASDPTGGAGLQADLLTIARLGCHPLSVLTALTAQDTRGVEALMAVETAWITRQAQVLLDDIPVAAFKLGVLGSARNAEAVAAILAKYRRPPMVLDPVLASGRGDALADRDTVQALRSALLPLTTVLTPNSLLREDRWPRLAGEYHGSGCTLASALAAYLAKGMEVPEAARLAQEFTWKALESGFAPGRGQHLPNRFFDTK
jgi:hydroxymethylpyrimidine/phosphomethylpyrimidine kinase